MRWKIILAMAMGSGLAATMPGADAGSPNATGQNIMQVLAATPTVELLRVVRDYADGLDVTAARDHAVRFEAERSTRGDTICMAAYQRWAELDPEAAFARADATIGGERVDKLNAVIRGWAKRAPREAWEELRELSSNFTDRRFDAGYPFTLLAEQDLTWAADKFREMPAQRQCLECLAQNVCLVAFVRGRADLIEALLAAMPDGEHRAALRDTYWEFVGQYEQARGWSRVGGWGKDTDRMAAELNLLKGWADVDYAASHAQALRLEPKARRDAALGVVLQTWGRGARSGDVAEIIAQLPDDLSEKAVLGLAGQFANLNPAATMGWAESLQTESLREEVQRRVMNVWTALQPEAARDYIRTQSDLEIRGILLWGFLFRRIDNHTFTVEDFDEILPKFAQGWKVDLLSKLVVQLVDPSRQADAFVKRQDIVDKITQRTDLLPAQRDAILKPLLTQ